MTSRRALLVALLAIFCLAANRGPIVITGAGWGGQPVPSGTPTATPTPSPTASATPTAAPEPGELFWFTDWEDADETNCDGDNATWVDADCQGGSYNGRYATGAIEGNYSGRSTTSTNNWAMSGKDVAVPHDDAYADFYWKAIAHDSGTSKRIVTMSNDATSWLCSLNVDHVSAGVLDMQMRVANGSGVGSAYTGADNTDYQIRIIMDKVDSDGALGGHFDCTVLIDPDGGTWGAGALFSHTVYATEYTGSGTGITHVEHYGHSGGWDSLIDGNGLCALPAVPGTRCAPAIGPTPTATATPTATPTAGPPTPTPTAGSLGLYWFNDFEDGTSSTCDGDSATYNDTDCVIGTFDGNYADAPAPLSGNYSGVANGNGDDGAYVNAAETGHTTVYSDFEFNLIAHTSGLNRRILVLTNTTTSWICSIQGDHVGADLYTVQVRSSEDTGVASGNLDDETTYQGRLILTKNDDTGNGHFYCQLLVDSDGDFGNGDVYDETSDLSEYTNADHDITGYQAYGYGTGWKAVFDDIGICYETPTPGVQCHPDNE